MAKGAKTVAEPGSWKAKDKNSKVNIYIALGAAVAVVVLAIAIPNFFSVNNFINLLVQVSNTGLLAVALTFTLIPGGIDLGVAQVCTLAGVAGAMVMNSAGVALGVLTMLGVAVIFGVANGLMVSKGKMLPFIVTLSTMSIAKGAIVFITDGNSIGGLPATYTVGFGGYIGIVPVAVFGLILIALVAEFILSRTRFGRSLYAIGNNEEAAKVSGLSTDFLKTMAYVVGSLVVGLCAVMLVARIEAAATSMFGDTAFTDAVAAAVIGGASLSGGKGSVRGTLVGALFIAVITNCMNLLSVEYYHSLIIKGLLIVAVIGLDRFRSAK